MLHKNSASMIFSDWALKRIALVAVLAVAFFLVLLVFYIQFKFWTISGNFEMLVTLLLSWYLSSYSLKAVDIDNRANMGLRLLTWGAVI
jgi:hypothetical protein